MRNSHLENSHFKTFYLIIRTVSDAHYENTEIEELLLMLKESESLEEQGDILHYLVITVGLSYDTGQHPYPYFQCKFECKIREKFFIYSFTFFLLSVQEPIHSQ